MKIYKCINCSLKSLRAIPPPWRNQNWKCYAIMGMVYARKPVKCQIKYTNTLKKDSGPTSKGWLRNMHLYILS